MEKRRIIVALFASLTVFYVYMFLVSRFAPPPKPATQPAAGRTAEGPLSGPEPTTQAATQRAGVAGSTRPGDANARQLIVEGGSEALVVPLGNAEQGNPYPMALRISSQGGTVESAEIRDYFLTVKNKRPYVVFSPMLLPGNHPGEMESFHSFATPRIRFQGLGLEAKLDDVNWEVVEQDKEKVVLGVTIRMLDGAPLARVLKTYRLEQQPSKPGGKGLTYDLEFAVTIDNLSGADLDAILTQQGPVGFRKEDPRAEDRRVVIARWEKGEFIGKGELRSEILKSPGKISTRDDDVEQLRVAWAAETNRYFACIMAPAGRLNADAPALFAAVEPATLRDQNTDHAEDLTYRFVTRPIVIAPGKSAEVGFDCYIGPKSKPGFEAVAAYRDRNYYEVIREGFYFCAPAALVSLMMTLLDLFHRVWPYNYGVSIIILVLVVRVLLHPLTKKSQVNMMKMQQQQASLQPKLKVIREKYANDKVKLNQATMDLYREEGVNPAGSILSCLPMFLQLPIWAALWTALSSTIEMRHAPFDGWWIRDLAGPDAVYVLQTPVHIPLISMLMGGPIDAINILPILLCISQMVQTLYMPKSTTPQPEGAPDQRKMMMFMSVLFIFFLWNAPSGLNLYIMASNVFGIVEQQRIRKHIKELEARRPEEEAKRKAKAQERPRGWFSRKWAELLREIEDAKKLQSNRDKKGDEGAKGRKRN